MSQLSRTTGPNVPGVHTLPASAGGAREVLPLVAPAHLAPGLQFLPDSSRSMGLHCVASRGAGKSRLLGRVAFQDLQRGVPQTIIDPMGALTDTVLDKISRLPKAEQEQLWPRIRYVDVAATDDLVTAFPLYYQQTGNDSPYTMSQRYLDCVRRLDVHLQTASVYGFNALWRIGTAAGSILSALGYQITEAEHLIRHPEEWQDRLTRAVALHPEVAPQAAFFTQEYLPLKPHERYQLAASFLNKIAVFSWDQSMRAMFGASEPGILWPEVVRDRLTVLVDFRHEHDTERLRFKLLWIVRYLLDFITARGAGRHRPISLMIDEITFLLSGATVSEELLAADLDYLINVLARNASCWVTIAHQEMHQVSEHIQKTFLSMGNQIFGSSTDLATAMQLARRFFRADPYALKYAEPIYASSRGVHEVIDHRPVFFSLEEQDYLNGLTFLDLPKFHFLVAVSPGEGTMPTRLAPVSTARLDVGQYVQEELVAQARSLLSRRDGQPVETVLAEITGRQPGEVSAGTASATPVLARTTRIRSTLNS